MLIDFGFLSDWNKYDRASNFLVDKNQTEFRLGNDQKKIVQTINSHIEGFKKLPAKLGNDPTVFIEIWIENGLIIQPGSGCINWKDYDRSHSFFFDSEPKEFCLVHNQTEYEQ